MIIKISKVKTYNWRFSKTVTTSITGEYWIENGSSTYADGDIGDMNHEGYVIDYIQRQYASDEFCNAEYVDWDRFLKNLSNKTGIEDQNKLMENIGMTQEEIDTVNDIQDPRIYGMKILGWKRIKGNNIETWFLTENDFKSIKYGLLDILESEGEYENYNETFILEVRSNNNVYYDVPLEVFESGTISDLLTYKTGGYYK